MKRRVRVLTFFVAACVLASASAAAWQNAQSSSSSQSSPASVQKTDSGEKSITGCVAKEGEGFVLKTDEGTYEFNTARDLSPYVGKKVQISGRWKATGVTTTAPIKATSASAQESSSKKGAAPTKAFVGDLHLHITGNVIGDCGPPK
ncbi:MAG TPA: DUF5818 domain-containing protein [Candidatus Sulfotelmatobacter sp.]|nr:DUF5818 domain-containing protein [Candidatus Sulfotelmatobacter sp.]